MVVLSTTSWAQIKIWTTHPQVAHDINKISKLYAGDQKPSFNAKEIYNLNDSADIHQFEPSSTELKKLSKYTPLVAGPLSHQPWLRLARNSGLLPKDEILALDQLGLGDHYWLNSKEAAIFEKKLQLFLNSLNIPTPNTLPWSDRINNEVKAIGSIIGQRKIKKIVLAHDALVPLFKTIPGIELLVLYSEDHHQEVTANTLKKVYNWAEDTTSVLFIYEKNITWPAPLKEERFNKIRTIKWSPVAPSPIRNLREELEAKL